MSAQNLSSKRFSNEDSLLGNVKTVSNTTTLKVKNKNIIEDGEDNKLASFHCGRCSELKESILKSTNLIRLFVDMLNERLNGSYHKTNKSKLHENSILSLDYYHTIYYSEIDKLKLGSDLNCQFRNLMRAIGLFGDKYEYITQKYENYEKLVSEYKSLKISNRVEESLGLNETEINEMKKVNIVDICKHYNQSKDSFEQIMKDLKNSLNTIDKAQVTLIIIFL